MGTLYEVYARNRDAQHLRDSDVARGAGIDPTALSDWKRGKAVPKLERLVKIADFLKIPVEEFAEAVR